jgi:Protein of unknown function (DUF1579)
MLDPGPGAEKNRAMNTFKTALAVIFASLSATLLVTPMFAQEPTPNESAAASPAGQMNDAEMMKQMMALSKLNENHKLLAQLAGTWKYDVKMWMAPDAPPMMSKGTAVRKPIMDGRYFVLNVTGNMKMPAGDGKMKNFEFKGMSIEGYDNVQKKFIATWCDNMGTGIMLSTGTYDPATKSFTYNSEMEVMPGMKTKAREVLKIVDTDHHNLEWYEDRGGQEVKTMEINYTRQK